MALRYKVIGLTAKFTLQSTYCQPRLFTPTSIHVKFLQCILSVNKNSSQKGDPHICTKIFSQCSCVGLSEMHKTSEEKRLALFRLKRPANSTFN